MTLALERYGLASRRASLQVIRTYSTSFGLASRLLGGRVRRDVVAVYALVRLADEVVDGAATDAGLEAPGCRAVLDALEAETLAAMGSGYSTNPIVQSFAEVACRVGVTPALVVPFFASMRADLDVRVHTAESFRAYVYGSAEVVGLMCLRCFLADDARRGVGRPTPSQVRRLEAGARALGAAFQKVNFLRDLGDDSRTLGRHYFPGVDPERLDAATRDRLLADVRRDLATARGVVPLLTAGSRAGVLATHALFAELARRLGRTDPAAIVAGRVRVPDAVKVALTARAVLEARLAGGRR
ncbi:phytoene synthase [Luteimicrobium album]|uniref:Phytoene synthase n=1 Tax=Luteimicrobium album TaxID=1054550 RepID=A0ABQ6I425_9MICO|nr:squalene/phytoene synthase family protein [Luteimicrobium album]GMA24992.1 phytoene synthase [Luteimicrobium album]